MKKNRLISIMTILFSIIFSIIFISCDKSSIDDENTITFWHFWSEPNQKTALDSIISVFEEEYDCNVSTTELSWNDGKTKLMAGFNSNTAPDVLELGSDWIAQFSSAGVLANLNKDTFNLKNFVDFSHSPGLWNNNLFAIPWVVDTRVLFVNNGILKKSGLNSNCPSSFNDILNQAELVNNNEGVYLFGVNSSDAHRLYKKVLTFFWTFGGDIFDVNGNPTINSPENVAALEFYLNLSRNGYLETQRQIDAAFTQGKIAYWISGGWLLDKIKNENPKLDYSVCLIPSINGKQGVSFAGGEYLAMNAKSKKQKLAAEFIKFMTDGKNAIEFCKKVTEAGFPADKKYFADPYYKAFPQRMVFASQLNNAKMTPVYPKWLEVEEIIEYAVSKALYGEMGAKGALDMAQEKVLSIK